MQHDVALVPVRFSSWMGGDRDGNPFVTSEVTRKVFYMNRWKAADLFLRDISNLAESFQWCTARLNSVKNMAIISSHTVWC